MMYTHLYALWIHLYARTCAYAYMFAFSSLCGVEWLGCVAVIPVVSTVAHHHCHCVGAMLHARKSNTCNHIHAPRAHSIMLCMYVVMCAYMLISCVYISYIICMFVCSVLLCRCDENRIGFPHASLTYSPLSHLPL